MASYQYMSQLLLTGRKIDDRLREADEELTSITSPAIFEVTSQSGFGIGRDPSVGYANGSVSLERKATIASSSIARYSLPAG